MFRYLITKNSCKKIFYNCFNNFIVCPIPKQTFHQNLTGDKIVRLDENSLQPRILKYFGECITCDKTEFNDHSITLNDYRADNLSKVDNNKLAYLIFCLSRPELKRKDFRICINNLDKECCIRLPKLTTPEIFNYLNNFMYYIPHIITRLTFYTKVIERMNFFIEHCSKIELLQLCFYVGLQKKSRESQIILRECLQKFNQKHLNNLNLNDLVILCNSAYKTSTKIESQRIIDKIVNTLYNNLSVFNDAAVCVTLIKSLRHNKYRSEELLATISHTIFFNNTIKYYNFTACTHILALYADTLHYDDNLFNLLSDKCVLCLSDTKSIKSRNEHFTKQIRVKDVARFLWSLSYIGYDNLSETIFSNYIEPLLDAYIGLGQLDKNIEHFIDSLLSMWIFGYQPSIKLFSTIITKNTVSVIHGKIICNISTNYLLSKNIFR